MNVLLSIKPTYVDEILAGKKRFEFRKAIFKKKDISKVFIYSSSPVQKIVASFEIAGIIEDSPQKLWDKCRKHAGILEEDFFEYFKNSDIGYAIEIKNLEKLSEPIDPYLLEKDFKPPQSYCYLPLDYFYKKSQSNSTEREYKTVFLTEDNEEYGPEDSAIEENIAQIILYSKSPKEKAEWVDTKLGSLIDFVGGGTPDKKTSEYWGGTIKWASVKDVKNKYLYETQDKITELGLKNSSSQLAGQEELILVTRISPGKCVIAKDNIAINQDLKIVRPKVDMSTKFLYYFFNSTESEFIKRSSGTTVKGIRLEEIRNIAIDLPPLPEQRAIVSKIELLFSELDNGIANLKLAQEQLKVYRQAVLDETTKTERFVPMVNVIEELGQGWSPKCHNEPSTNDEEWGVIKTTAIQAGYFNEKENKKLPNSLEPRIKHELKAGDVLITRAGPRARVGVCCLVKKVRPRLINCDKAYRIKLKTNLILPDFFEYTLNSPKYTLKIEDLKTGISDSGVNLTHKRFVDLNIPLPPLAKQQAIVNEIETRLSVCDKVEQDIAENLEKAEALRQSILKKAFEGKLLSERELAEVRKAEDWEPAEVLLERVKGEKTGRK
ncbi:restriction endonuclease subunit S [Methanolobus sp. WCC5]|uniref:restriction endonuclease subunit S n=1 Tax=Methanolobus sp. WCC5 TaxID=3125785 RepID=UPI00324C37D3